MKKRMCALLLALCMTAALAVPVLAAGSGFRTVNVYTPGQFTDVPEGIWCADNVKTAYEYGIMTGKGENWFDVDGSLTIAETIVMACRIHSGLTGTPLPDYGPGEGDAWYVPYLGYAMENGILWMATDYNAPVTRADFAAAMDSALTEQDLPVISSIEAGAIPDVPASSGYYDAVYRLYEAGILTGNDAKGTFTPYSTITRGAAAALMSRIADPSLRRAITLVKAPFEPVPISQLQNYTSLKKKCTDAEFQAAYDAALKVVEPLAGMSLETQLEGVAVALREMFDSGMSYSTSDAHYNDPYGYLVLGTASCAGCTRATGLCLNILGIPYEHVNENQWSHQWCRVNVNGTYWICDAYGLYCGPEPAPYEHPYF